MSQDLRQGIMPLPIRDPSQVLFQLLGLLISAGKDISSVQDAMAGQKPGENVSAATVTALIEQGLKVFSGIYKRLYRSMSEELKMIYALNSKYGDYEKYQTVVDVDIKADDFTMEGYDLVPSADPEFSLDIQRVGKAEALLKISGRPGLDEDGVTAAYLQAIKAPEELLLPPESRQKPPPNPEMEKIGIEYQRLGMEKDMHFLEKMKLRAQIEELRTKAMNYIAKAESEEAGIQLDEYKLFVDQLGAKLKEMEDAESRRVQSMEDERNNQEGNQNAVGAEGGAGQQPN
jgi:chaperonin GroES